MLSKRLTIVVAGERQKGARCALVVLSSVNLLNFADRYVPSAVKQPIKDELDLTDLQTTLPTSGMVVVFMVSAVIFGWLADKEVVDRRKIIAGAILFWSVATSLAGFARNISQLVLFRSLVGVGEGAYATIAMPMLADFYPARDRNIVYAVYSLFMVVGGALGYTGGAVLCASYGWRGAFFICGAPGVVAAFLVLCLNDPARRRDEQTTADTEFSEVSSGSESAGDDDARLSSSRTAVSDARLLLANGHYLVALAGQTTNLFAIGALADWLDSFLMRYQGSSLKEAGLVVGATTALGGLFGTVLGSKIAEHFADRCSNAYFIVSAVFSLPAAMLLAVALNVVHSKLVVYLCLFLAQVCFFTNLAPMSAVLMTSVPAHLRARSSGFQVFVNHVLGDVISPPIVGAVSDLSGSLRAALQITWVMVLASGVLWCTGGWCLPPLAIGQPKQAKGAELGYYSVLCDGGARDDPASESDSGSEAENESDG